MKAGGLGIRSAVQLAPSAFLSSAAASSDLVHLILPPRFGSQEVLHVGSALTPWSLDQNHPPPVAPASHHQKVWDTTKVSAPANALLENAPDALSRAHLLVASAEESGAWLNALPISSLGLRMDDNTIRVSVGLRLGTTLCRPHACHHCGAEVNHLGTHGLSCVQSEGRHHRHAALNDIVHRALTAAHIPSRLEPSGIFRSDGKRPDGITVVRGRGVGSWCGTRPAQTHSQLRTFPVLPVMLERSQLQQKSERSESTLTSTRGIRSSRSPLRLQEVSARRPCCRRFRLGDHGLHAGIGQSPPAGVC